MQPVCLNQFEKTCWFQETRKSFYKDYWYKLDTRMESPGFVSQAYRSFYPNSDLENLMKSYVKQKKDWRDNLWDSGHKLFNGAGFETGNTNNNLMIKWLSRYTKQVRVRAEYRTLSVYFKTEQDLSDFIAVMPAEISPNVTEAQYPANDQIKQIVNDGYVIIKKPIAQKYLVTATPSWFEIADTTRLHEYLKNIDAKFTSYQAEKMTTEPEYGSRRWFDGLRFYVHEVSHAEFIHLVLPKVKLKIKEVKLMP